MAELRPPKEFHEFVRGFEVFYESKIDPQELIEAIPDGCDITRALDETALWLLTNKTYGVAAFVPKDSPNQKGLRAYAKLLRRKIAGEYITDEDFERLKWRFIYDTTWPGEIEEMKEERGITFPKYKADEVERSAISGVQEVMTDPKWRYDLAGALSWFCMGKDSTTEGGFDPDHPHTQAAVCALVEAFKAAARS
jgi:hypothetical protein